MAHLIVRRLLDSALMIFGVLTLVFLAAFVVGDPARMMLPPETPRDQVIAFRHQMGFDRPIPVQFVDFMGGVIRGDFGDSWWQRAPALPIALQPLPATLLLAGVAILIAVAVGLPLGIAGSLRPGSVVDRLAVMLSLIGLSLPVIWLGLMLILIFAVELSWFPTSGYGTWRHLVLPGVSLALLPLGRIAQIGRSAMIDELSKQYVVTAKAKGLRQRAVVRHALKNAALPLITTISWEFTLMIAGYTVVIETVFGWPGIGLQLYNAIENQDMPLIAATVFLVSGLVVFINFITDVLYAALDPRVAYR